MKEFWPGIGNKLVSLTYFHDLAMIVRMMVSYYFIFIIGNSSLDLYQIIVDPRIRIGVGGE